MRRATEGGFSLIETLVAMTVLAVSSTAILSATETHTRTVGAVSDRMLARWVASNALVALGHGQPVPDSVEMGGSDWRVIVDRRDTSDPGLNRVDIDVVGSSAPNVVLARLTGFVKAAPGVAQ